MLWLFDLLAELLPLFFFLDLPLPHRFPLLFLVNLSDLVLKLLVQHVYGTVVHEVHWHLYGLIVRVSLFDHFLVVVVVGVDRDTVEGTTLLDLLDQL